MNNISQYLNGIKSGIKSGYYNPIHIILWRMIWFIPVVLSLSIFLLVYGIGWGYKEAIKVFRNLW